MAAARRMHPAQPTIDYNLIATWLRSWGRKQASLNLLGGAATVLGGVAILVVTWGTVYIFSLFALGPWLGFHHWVHSIAGLLLIPLLFWGNARTSREYLSEYAVSTGTTSETVFNFYLPGVGLVSNVNPLAPSTMAAGVKMIVDCLYLGPRVVLGGIRMLQSSRRLQQLEVTGCAAVLSVLFVACRKMSFQEIFQ